MAGTSTRLGYEAHSMFAPLASETLHRPSNPRGTRGVSAKVTARGSPWAHWERTRSQRRQSKRFEVTRECRARSEAPGGALDLRGGVRGERRRASVYYWPRDWGLGLRVVCIWASVMGLGEGMARVRANKRGNGGTRPLQAHARSKMKRGKAGACVRT